MSNKPKKILILSSGGDAPGMNAAIRAVVRAANFYDLEIYGTEAGFWGLIKEKLFSLKPASVANIIQRGGTILKTGRCEEFKQPEVREKCLQFLIKNDINAMIILGGDGSFTGARLLTENTNIQVIGIPCTIDNDVQGTDYCIGVDTARNTALEAIDKIRDTALSLERNFIIEVMGRASGFLAVDVGIAGGAEVILIPEFPVSTKELVKKIQHQRRTKLTSIMVVAEADQAGHSLELAKEIKKLSGIEYKVCILGHTQRGGTPTATDRKLASIMGVKAIEGILAEQSNSFTAATHGKVILVPFPDPENATRFFNDTETLRMNDIICEI